MYSSPPHLVPYSPSHHNINDYFVGQAVLSTAQLPSYTTREAAAPPVNNYTCTGAPVGRGFIQGSGDGRDTSTLQYDNNNNNNHKCTTSNSNNNDEGEEDGKEENRSQC